MNIKQIESKIRRSIKRAQKNGYKIKAGDWGIRLHQRFTYDFTKFRFVLADKGKKCLCPIEACLIGKNANFPKNLADVIPAIPAIHAAKKLFKKNEKWIRSFTDGFDGCNYLEKMSYTVPSAFNLGKKFRKEFLNK